MLESGFSWGFRVGGELLKLQVGQIDFKDNVVRLEVDETKNREGREVPMTNTIRTLLLACCEGKKKTDRVFTRNGQPIVDYRDAWHKVTKPAGMENLLSHDLRRSAVRVMVRSGLNENIAMSISGHKSRDVFSRYNIVSAKDKVKAMKKREAYLVSVNRKSNVPVHSQSAHNQEPEQIENLTSKTNKALATNVM